MKTEPIRPAAFDPSATRLPGPHATANSSTAGARLTHAQLVHLVGNGLPARWAGREHFALLQTAFGDGAAFLATWQAWRRDPGRPRRLSYLAIEPRPPRAEDLPRWHAGHPLPELAHALRQQWPQLTANIHELSFEDGRVRLLLALGRLPLMLKQLSASVDAFFVDAPAAHGQGEAAQPPDRHLLKQFARLAQAGATLTTCDSSVSPALLRSAGFAAQQWPATADRPALTTARFEPRVSPPGPAGWAAATGPRKAAIIGAGLAGSAAAHALSREGWECLLFDQHETPAQETSGNAGGLFHGIVNAHDGAHARFNRSAALHAQALLRELRERHPIQGQFEGLLRLENAGHGAEQARQAMEQSIQALGLPPGYVRAASPAEARALSGLPLQSPAWFYPGGGWLRPADLVRAWLADVPGLFWRPGQRVAALQRTGDEWALLDQEGQVLATAPVVVLANALDAARLLPAGLMPPVAAVRGQTTLLPAGAPGLRAPLRPVAGTGYLLPAHEGWVMCGATSQPGDTDTALRAADHAHNLAQLARLSGSQPQVAIDALRGRVGWRCVTDDRLPLIGPVAASIAASTGAGTAARLDHARHVPRERGLYLLTGLASRGIAWAPLAGQVLARWIAGTPVPLESDLRDAVDAARFVSRQARRGASEEA